MTTTTKATRTTLKSFIRKSGKGLLISVRSRFDGMTDGCQDTNDREFTPALLAERACDNNYGIQGAWLVLGGRDWIESYETETHIGYKVSNCCGRFILAVAK
jgi:hypothetical protein